MTFVPYGSENWAPWQWEVFKKCYPDADDRDSFDFDGDYDCNDGAGKCSWSGETRRCSCGNRRVYWYFDGNFVYPDPY